MLKQDRENRKLKQRIRELELEIERLNNESPTIIEDEIVVRLFQALTIIAEDSENSQATMCKDVLSRTPDQIIVDVQLKYRREGIVMAANLCKSKAEQARDLESELTAITAESIADAIEKMY